MNKPIRIAITPLSPLHIGCGEDYEPTRYVVNQDKRLLYSFNPESVRLSKTLHSELLSAAQKGQFEDICRFYDKHVKDFRPWAKSIVSLDSGSLAGYRKMISPQGNQKRLNFCVQRTAYEVSFSVVVPYVPGSGIKGLIKTAKVDALNQGRSLGVNDNIDEVFFHVQKNCFESSPLRFLKVSDLHAVKGDVSSSIHCAKRFFTEGQLKYCGISDFFETINPAQYRAFLGEITLSDASHNPEISHVYSSILKIVGDLNGYSRKIWQYGLGFYRRADPVWTQSVGRLIEDLAPSMQQGKVALVRLGKNTGADSKTLSEGVAQIEIRHKNKSLPKEKRAHPTTMWFLPEDRKSVDGTEVASGMPFGWALIEVLEGDEENPVLRAWCKKVRERTISVEKALEEERQTILRERVVLQNEIEKALNQEKAENEKRQKEEDERLAREEALSKLTPEERSIENIIAKLSSTTGLINPGSELFREVKTLLENALTWERPQDKKALAEKISPFMKKRGLYQGKAEKVFKAQLRELRGE